MFGRIYAIALNTFREAIRQRVLYGVIAVVVGLNVFALVLGEMSLHEEGRVALDVGLGGISMFGSITAIFLGVSLLYTEIQRRTIHSIVCKPIERWEFVLGKYLGMVMTLSVLVLVFTFVMSIILRMQDVPFTLQIGKAVILSYFEVLVVAAIAVFFSAFTSPFLSGIFTTGLWILGRITPEMRSAVDQAKVEWVRPVADVALKFVPDMHLFSVSGSLVDGDHVSVHTSFVEWSYVATSMAYGLACISVMLLLAVVVFTRRDFV